MKRFVFVCVVFCLFSAVSCRSHRQDVKVSVLPEFSAEEVWELTSVRGRAVTYAEGQKHATLCVNPEAGTVSGHNGCNSFFGNFENLGNGKMKLTQIMSTKMACPEPFHKLESQYMQTLSHCDGYDINAYSLNLMQGEKIVLSFDKQQSR